MYDRPPVHTAQCTCKYHTDLRLGKIEISKDKTGLPPKLYIKGGHAPYPLCHCQYHIAVRQQMQIKTIDNTNYVEVSSPSINRSKEVKSPISFITFLTILVIIIGIILYINIDLLIEMFT